MSIDKAIILSAGQGSRLLPLTRDIPKCLIEFNGRSLISWQVAALVANGIKDIVVVTGFRTERVEDHALQLYRFNSSMDLYPAGKLSCNGREEKGNLIFSVYEERTGTIFRRIFL